MEGYVALVLHAHLPFVRHPEVERSLEENWLFEAITECYLPLIQVLEGWCRDRMDVRLTLSVSPTLCAMLSDPLLQDRYLRHLERLIDLAERETFRTNFDAAFHPLARMYHQRFVALRKTYLDHRRNLVLAWARFRDIGKLELATTAATHAVLPLLAQHPPSLRAQVRVARDHFKEWFGAEPHGFWLPECAYSEEVEPALRDAGFRWFIVEAHGLLHARPRPRYGLYAPVYTPEGLAAFGRDIESAKQVWSRQEGYPGDPFYRDFYRDIGYDLDYEYLREYMPVPGQRSFTGIKYYAISGQTPHKAVYDRAVALQTAAQHAQHFLEARQSQIQRVGGLMNRAPIVVCPYDAELFGHWWYEGPEFLDYFVRKTYFDQSVVRLTSPWQYLREHPTQQVAQPAGSSWGEEGYWSVWLNEETHWLYPHLDVAQRRMTELAQKFTSAEGLTARALKQAGRELLLAQSSDWPFILRTKTSPAYARQRFEQHILRFTRLYEQLMGGRVDEAWLRQIESVDNLFPHLDYRYWA